MPKTRYLYDAAELMSVLTDESVDVTDFNIVRDDVLQIHYRNKEDFLQESNTTNIFIACFTTCWARLKLYDVLEKLDRRVLYFDTGKSIK